MLVANDMDDLEKLRVAASELLSKARDAPLSELSGVIEQVTAAQRLLFEAENAKKEERRFVLEEEKLRWEVDTAPARERSERQKQYVTLFATVFAPVLTFLALALSLVAQNWQFREAELEKSNAELDAKWTAAVRTISEDTKLPPAIVALQPFLASPRYAAQARLTAIQLAVNGKDPAFLDALLVAAFTPATWSNLGDLVAVDRGLRLRESTHFAEMQRHHPKNKAPIPLTSDEAAEDNYLGSAVNSVSAQLGFVFSAHRPAGLQLDLSRTLIRSVDLSSADVHGASLEGADLIGVDLAGADLSGITKFANLDAYVSAWWEAKAISPELLGYLGSQYPCDPAQSYGVTQKRFSREQCNADLDRLRRNTELKSHVR